MWLLALPGIYDIGIRSMLDGEDIINMKALDMPLMAV
jgi:hypothetical protein